MSTADFLQTDPMTTPGAEPAAIRWRPVLWVSAGLLLLFVAAVGEKPHNYELDFTEYSAQIENAVSEGTPVRRIAFLTLGALGLWGAFRPQGQSLRIGGATAWLALALLGWCGMTIAWTTDLGFTVRRLFVLAMVLAAAVALVRHFSMRELLWIGLVSGMAHLTLDVLTAAALGLFRPWEPGYRFTGFLFPNYEAVLAGLTALTALALAPRAERGKGWLYLAAAVALALLFLTKSRTSLLATLAGFALWRLLCEPRGAKILLTLGLIGMLVASASAVDPQVVGRTMDLLSLDRHDSDLTTLSGRLPLWEELSRFIDARPWTGYGYSSFWTVERIEEVADSQGWVAPHAHSDYVEMALSAGLIGAGLMIVLWLLGLGGAAQAARHQPGEGYEGVCAWLSFMVVGGIADCMALFPSLFQLLFLVGLVHLAFRRPAMATAETPLPSQPKAWTATSEVLVP